MIIDKMLSGNFSLSLSVSFVIMNVQRDSEDEVKIKNRIA